MVIFKLKRPVYPMAGMQQAHSTVRAWTARVNLFTLGTIGHTSTSPVVRSKTTYPVIRRKTTELA